MFNLSQYVTHRVGNQRHALTTAFEHKFTDTFSFFGDVLYSNTRTYSQINGQPLNIGAIPAGEFGNPFDVAATGRNRLVNNPRQYLSDTTDIRGVAGFRGFLTDNWTWEVAANYNRITQDYRNPGVINNANLITAVEEGDRQAFASGHASTRSSFVLCWGVQCSFAPILAAARNSFRAASFGRRREIRRGAPGENHRVKAGLPLARSEHWPITWFCAVSPLRVNGPA